MENNKYDIEMGDLIKNHTYSSARKHIDLLNSDISLSELYNMYKTFTSHEFYIFFLNNDAEDIHYIISNFIIHKMRGKLLNESSLSINSVYFYINDELNKKDCKNIHDIRLINLLELLCQVQNSESLEDFCVYLFYLNQVFFKEEISEFIIEDKLYICNHLLTKFMEILKNMTNYEIVDYIVYQNALYYSDNFIFLHAYHDLINKTMYLSDTDFINFYYYFRQKKKLNIVNFYYNLNFMYDTRMKIIYFNKKQLVKIYIELFINQKSKKKNGFTLSNFDYETLGKIICFRIKSN